MKFPIFKISQSFLKNKYLISFVFFFLWVAVLDSYSWYNRMQLEKRLDSLKAEKAFLEKKIKHDSINLHNLKTNKSNLEKFAREKFFMKKDNEDVFVICQESEE